MKDVVIEGFVHVGTLGHWERVSGELFGFAAGSGLLQETTRVHRVTVGPFHCSPGESFGDRCLDVDGGVWLTEFEFPTLDLLHRRCSRSDSPDLVWYVHTKGTIYEPNEKSRRWRRAMADCVLGRGWREMVDRCSSGEPCCGPFPGPDSFRGNFWWARADYVRTLERPPRANGVVNERHRMETWIRSGRPGWTPSPPRTSSCDYMDSPHNLTELKRKANWT